MAIEITDEMIERAGAAMFGERPLNPIRRKHLRGVVAAVLALVERNQAGHVLVDAEALRIALNQRNTHAHVVPGRWDGTGAACTECAARSRLYSALFARSRS